MEDAYLLDRWDHTALLACYIQHLTALVHNAVTKGGRIRPIGFEKAHPYRVETRKGLKITSENFQVLKTVAGAAAKYRT